MRAFADVDSRLALADIVAQVSGDKDAGDVDLTALRGHIKDLRVDLNALTSAVQDMRAEVNVLKTKVNNHEARIVALEARP